MTQSNDTSNRLTRVENDVIDLRVATSALIESVNVHQRNFETLIAEMQRDRAETQRNFETLIAGMQRDRAEIQQYRTQTQLRIENLEQVAQDTRQILQLLTQRLTGGN
ncbi:MAG: hypothetical protein WCD18_17525 [Thermosynechococcaceae cyanobacterium]